MNDILSSAQRRLNETLKCLRSHSPDSDQDIKMGQMLVKLNKPRVLIPVTGEKGSGKTTLVNAMLGGRLVTISVIII